MYEAMHTGMTKRIRDFKNSKMKKIKTKFPVNKSKAMEVKYKDVDSEKNCI
jgi:hypothetical protein